MVTSSFQQVYVLTCGYYHNSSKKNMYIPFRGGFLLLTGLCQMHITYIRHYD